MAQRKSGKQAAKSASAANVGYEAQLWRMADTLRNNMDAAEYKHVVLALGDQGRISRAALEEWSRTGGAAPAREQAGRMRR